MFRWSKCIGWSVVPHDIAALRFAAGGDLDILSDFCRAMVVGILNVAAGPAAVTLVAQLWDPVALLTWKGLLASLSHQQR